MIFIIYVSSRWDLHGWVSTVKNQSIYPTVCKSLSLSTSADSPSPSGDVAVYVFDINQPSLPTPFYSVLVSIFVFMGLSNAFQSIRSSNKSPLSHSVFQVLFLSFWSIQPYISL